MIWDHFRRTEVDGLARDKAVLHKIKEKGGATYGSGCRISQ